MLASTQTCLTEETDRVRQLEKEAQESNIVLKKTEVGTEHCIRHCRAEINYFSSFFSFILIYAHSSHLFSFFLRISIISLYRL